MAIAVNRPLTNCKQLRYNANTHYKDCEGNKICAREPKRAAYAESGAAAQMDSSFRSRSPQSPLMYRAIRLAALYARSYRRPQRAFSPN